MRRRIDFDLPEFLADYPDGKFDMPIGGSKYYTSDLSRAEDGTIVLREKAKGEVRYVAAYGPHGLRGWTLMDGELVLLRDGSLEAARQIISALSRTRGWG